MDQLCKLRFRGNRGRASFDVKHERGNGPAVHGDIGLPYHLESAAR